jgi:hypothetical protein
VPETNSNNANRRGTTMKNLIRLMMVCSALVLSACASTFVATWKAPDAQPLELKGAKIAAVVMMQGQSSRRLAEDTLAREITARGAQGITMYSIVPDTAPANEPATRAALEKAGIQGIVVMRPMSVNKDVSATPVKTYADPNYHGYWGGYHGYGWGSPWTGTLTTGGDMRVDTVVMVETLVYSLKQNKLVWSGQSKNTNPPEVEDFVRELAAATAATLKKEGLLAR